MIWLVDDSRALLQGVDGPNSHYLSRVFCLSMALARPHDVLLFWQLAFVLSLNRIRMSRATGRDRFEMSASGCVKGMPSFSQAAFASRMVRLVFSYETKLGLSCMSRSI